MRIKCPHCGADGTIRTSRPFSETTREASVQCTNVECAHTWVVTISATRTIAPSMIPNPRVYIPLSPRSPAVLAEAGANQGALDLGPYNPRAAPG